MNTTFGNGRFAATSDSREVVSARAFLWKQTFWLCERIPEEFTSKDNYWVSGIDKETQAPVFIHPRGFAFGWKNDIDLESQAKRVQALALPETVPILHVGGGIVFAKPPPAQPRPRLTVEQAAQHAFVAAAVTARLHAEGCGQLAFGPSNLRLVEESGTWKMHWIVPGIRELDLYEVHETLAVKTRRAETEHARWRYDLEPVRRSLWQLMHFFLSLAGPNATSTAADSAAALTSLLRLQSEGPDAAGIKDAASLARRFAILARLPASAADSLPVVQTLPRRFPNWDDVIADGEMTLQQEKHHTLPVRLALACAYHQRASRSWARGEIEMALADVERAIVHDSFTPYLTTQAILLDALKRHDEARAAIERAFASATTEPEDERRWIRQQTDDVEREELGRAYLVRGFMAWREGQLEAALQDVERAHGLRKTPQTKHAIERLRRLISA